MENERKVIPFPRRETEGEQEESLGMLSIKPDTEEYEEEPDAGETDAEDETEELLDIDYVSNEETRALWDALFPNGKPTPEELIQKLAELLKP